MRQTVCNLDALPILLSIKDLQSLLGVSRSKAYELCNNELASATMTIAGKYRIKRDEIFALLYFNVAN